MEKAVSTNQILHSYLFLGPEGIGKKIVAREFAKNILKGELENHPDFTQIEPDGNSIKIEQIRIMRRKNSRKANCII